MFFIYSSIVVLSIIYRVDLPSMYVPPSGQHNGHLLLLSAAVQPVYSLRWVSCVVSFPLCLVLQAEYASIYKHIRICWFPFKMSL